MVMTQFDIDDLAVAMFGTQVSPQDKELRSAEHSSSLHPEGLP